MNSARAGQHKPSQRKHQKHQGLINIVDQPSNFTFSARANAQNAGQIAKKNHKEEAKIALAHEKKSTFQSTAEFKHSVDFNPLLSNSKLWRHSPIRNEKSGLDEVALSPGGGDADLSVAEEGRSPSPIPKQGFGRVGMAREFDEGKVRGAGITNFHDNYLRLGLWPEMSYENQALLRNSFKNGMIGQGKRDLSLKQNMSYAYLQSSMNDVPTNITILPPTGRKRITSLMASQDSQNSSWQFTSRGTFQAGNNLPGAFQAPFQNKLFLRAESNYSTLTKGAGETRCQRCTSVDSYQTGVSGQDKNYKDGLVQAITLINTLIDQISQQNNESSPQQKIRHEIEEESLEKENQQPKIQSFKYSATCKIPRCTSKTSNRSSHKELKHLVGVIKRAKAQNESVASAASRNVLEVSASGIFPDHSNFNSSMGAGSPTEQQLPPLSGRPGPFGRKRENSENLMRQVLGRLHKLNQVKRGMTLQQKDEINQSVLAICDLIL